MKKKMKEKQEIDLVFDVMKFVKVGISVVFKIQVNIEFIWKSFHFPFY